MIKKTDVFKDELSWVQDKKIRGFAEKAISMLPDYFFEVAASSTGKYHPKYALGEGGLVRHTKAAVGIAKDLLQLEMYQRYNTIEKDLILVALMLHDGFKSGKTKSTYTLPEHPTIMSNWLLDEKDINKMIPKEQLDILAGAISSHMGQWNTDFRSKKEILPKPITAIQKMVHMCDYLASRKYLEYDFGEKQYVLDDYRDTAAEDLYVNVQKILAIMKKKIDKGVDKNTLYDIITAHNSGRKNPNSITELEISNKILKELEEIN